VRWTCDAGRSNSFTPERREAALACPRAPLALQLGPQDCSGALQSVSWQNDARQSNQSSDSIWDLSAAVASVTQDRSFQDRTLFTSRAPSQAAESIRAKLPRFGIEINSKVKVLSVALADQLAFELGPHPISQPTNSRLVRFHYGRLQGGSGGPKTPPSSDNNTPCVLAID
jgi:hypothetical protein